MGDLFESLRAGLAGKRMRIALPEGTDERVVRAAAALQREGVVAPVLLGSAQDIRAAAAQAGVDASAVDVIDPGACAYFEELVARFVERRKGKATEEEARRQLRDLNTFGAMLVYTGRADGLVSGAAHTTAETVRPALQIIKTKPGVSKTSGAFFMVRGSERYVFADCAISIAPDADDLAEIAIESAKTARLFGIEPKVAMLSFSTKGSAQSAETERVAAAVKRARELAPDLAIDGEFQFDAAIVPAIADKKAPGARLRGDANVFVFPSLEAGNIGYKIAERLGGFEAIGPVLQGLAAPVNDLSRGCSAADVEKLALITAMQAAAR